MRKEWIVILVLLLTACASEPNALPEVKPAIEPEVAVTEIQALNPTLTPLPAVEEEVQIPDLPRDTSNLVTPSENCVRCHTALTDDDGNDVSFDVLWRSSMMANAAVDPYWIATVSSEVLLQPELANVIEDKCVTCHMPLARFDAVANQEDTNMFGDGFLNSDHQLHNLAMDGISCNLCHQIEPDNFDQEDSFSGGYLLNATDFEWDGRVSYGPFLVNENMAGAMLNFSGYRPVQSEHITESALCGTCHNLYTPYLDGEGNVVGDFPEQMTYMEWQNSEFEASASCQQCHMPIVEGGISIATIGRGKQDYLRMHTFTGANAFMTNILKENAVEIGVKTEEQQLENTISRIEEQMLGDVGAVQLSSAEIIDGQLLAEVLVSSEVGHKFPSGYPSRRVWLHFIVMDVAGNVVFESGAVQANGLIVGNDNDADATTYEPHYKIITDPAQVQIYETILGNTDNQVTTTLLRAAAYLKDNRLLPLGFDPAEVSEDIGVYGDAASDESFKGGGDSISYQIDVDIAQGPFTVTVELLYQSIGYRWADNLRDVDTAEASQFMDYYDIEENTPLFVDAIEVIVGE